MIKEIKSRKNSKIFQKSSFGEMITIVVVAIVIVIIINTA